MATVIVERHTYTEEIHYDDNGVELGRVRQDDDLCWGRASREMTDDEREDWELDD